MKSKKAMSAIITTVIMVALVLVAIGIVWAVINNLIKSKSDDISLQTDCLKVNIEATSATSCSGTDCTVYLKRDAGGRDVAGVKIVFGDGTTTGTVLDLSGDIDELATINQNYPDVGITDPTEVGVTVYFHDSAGNEKICSATKTKVLV